ncbi:MAG: bifunctional 5,10-methylenetetrahydrofolate dehydrogenase/5,10-methenyltetrahydrofolate cyclohydrolase [Nocardioidaceae bacterium]
MVDGARIRDELIGRVRVAVDAAHRSPCLGIVYDGSSAASRRWTGYKRDACSRAAIRLVARDLDGDASTDAGAAVVRKLDDDPDVDAIFLQTPLPRRVNPVALAQLVSPGKDVDGLHGGLDSVAATAQAALCVLERHEVPLRAERVVILGGADPILDSLGALLAARGALMQSVAPADPAARRVCSQARVLVTAVGRPGLVDADWLSPGAVIIDAGVLIGGGTDGDVAPEAAESQASLLCPARGGLGPVTVAVLLWRTVQLAGVPLRPETRA